MFSHNRSSLLASAFSPLIGFRFGIHFDTPDDDSGGTGGGTATLPAPAPTQQQQPPTTPASGGAGDGGSDDEGQNDHQRQRAIKERRKARQAFIALCKGLGIDPNAIRTVQTGDPTNPVRIESIHGGDINAVLNAARVGIAAAGGSRGQRGSAVAAVELETLRGQVATLQQQNKALTKYIRKMSVVLPIRAACAKNGAIDDDNGNYSDIVRELEPLFQVEIDIDPDNANAEPDVTVTPMAAGKPMMNATANAVHSPESLVIDLLTRKPKHRQANFRAGPGAGAHRVGAAAVNGNGNGRQFSTTVTPAAEAPETDSDKTTNSVAAFFGLSPEVVKRHSNA